MTMFWIKEIPGANSTSVRSMMQHVILRRFRYAETGFELDWTHSFSVNLEHFLTDIHTKSAETKLTHLHLFPLPFLTSSLLCLLIGKKRVIVGGSAHLCKVRLHSSKKQNSRGTNFRASFSKKSFPFVSAPAPAPHSAFVAASLLHPLRPTLLMHWKVSGDDFASWTKPTNFSRKRMIIWSLTPAEPYTVTGNLLLHFRGNTEHFNIFDSRIYADNNKG